MFEYGSRNNYWTVETQLHRKIYPTIKSRKKKKSPDAWEGMFGTLEYTAVMEQDLGTEIIVDFEDGTTEAMSGAEVYAVIF